MTNTRNCAATESSRGLAVDAYTFVGKIGRQRPKSGMDFVGWNTGILSINWVGLPHCHGSEKRKVIDEVTVVSSSWPST